MLIKIFTRLSLMQTLFILAQGTVISSLGAEEIKLGMKAGVPTSSLIGK